MKANGYCLELRPKMNIKIIAYDENGANEFPGIGYGSMKENFQNKPYPEKKVIIQKLKTCGHAGVASTGNLQDCFTGEFFAPGDVIRVGGGFSWTESLAYYVEKYNLRLPKDFEEYLMK